MKILVLGGTVFIGRHLVNAALEQGHDVTIFTRGKHNPNLFPQVERLQGDRRDDLAALQGRDWDVVIDTSGYLPSVVAASVDLLKGHVRQYVFLSTVDTYGYSQAPGFNEQTPTIAPPADIEEKVTYETYGPLKVLCEHKVKRGFKDNSLILRLGYMIGPHDRPGRFAYWPARIAQGGEVLAPGPKSAPVQLADARDAAHWTINMIESNQNGIYLVCGEQTTMEELLNTCRDLTNPNAKLTWVDPDTVINAGLNSIHFPTWIPPEFRNIDTADATKAYRAGLRLRPLKDTIQDIHHEYQTRPTSEQQKEFELKPEQEEEVLAST